MSGATDITRGRYPTVRFAGLAESGPIWTLTGTAIPWATVRLGTTTRTLAGTASLISAAMPPTLTVSGLPSRFWPWIRISWPGMATSGSRPVTRGAR